MNKFKYPLISIVIVTLNSERTLATTLSSIRKQNYPRSKIEILLIDGGSIDKTKEIAKEYKCRIINNPKTEIIYRKQIGLFKALGKYLVYLDSDESFENPQSLKLKYLTFLKNHLVKSVISQGFKSPRDSSFINDYANDLGDPFSFYLYRESYSDKFLIKDRRKKYRVLEENNDYIIFDINSNKYSSLIEPWAGGSMIDLEYAKSAFPLIKENSTTIPLLSYLFNSKGKLVAITKNDPIVHDSSMSFGTYLKKISSRIKNNVFQTKLGKGGYSGREQYQNRSYTSKKFFYPIYAFSFILPFIDSVYLSISRRKVLYLVHSFLSVYTAALIIYFITLKVIGFRPKIGAYGG